MDGWKVEGNLKLGRSGIVENEEHLLHQVRFLMRTNLIPALSCLVVLESEPERVN